MLACIGYVLSLAFLVDQTTASLCREIDGPNATPASVLPAPLLEIAYDGYLWNHHAEKLGQDGSWRMRYTDFDNAPFGREVHWNSGFAWYLRGLGEICRHFTGESLRSSIFRMSIWANPILLALALCLFPTLGAKRFGPLCGSVLAVAMVTTSWFSEGFLPAYPDHHGIASLALLGIVLGIAWAGAGWVQPPRPGGGRAELPPANSFAPASLKIARQGILLSGISAACALWISAFSASLMAVAIGIGILTGSLIFGRKASRESFPFFPPLWLLWGIVAASGSLFFYLLEYFPFHLGLRLEVNNPLYGLAWLGGGGILYETTRWLTRTGENPLSWKRLLIPSAACLALPITLWAGGPALYLPRDPFLQGILGHIAEVLPLLTCIEIGALTWGDALGYYPLLLLISLALLFDPRLTAPTKSLFLVLSSAILVITSASFLQLRWAMLNGPLYIVLAGLLIPTVWNRLPKRPAARLPALLCLLLLAFVSFHSSAQKTLLPLWNQYTSIPQQPAEGALRTLLHRDIARTLLAQANGKPITLLSSPNSSCLIAAFGGFRTVGTLYWENLEGLQTAARIFSSTDDRKTLALLQDHGVTHVCLMPWENFLGPYFQTLQETPDTKNPEQTPRLEDTFGYRALVQRTIPQWARPIPYPQNPIFAPLHQNILLLEIVPNQTAQEAALHLLKFCRVQEGSYPPGAEAALQKIAAQSPESFEAPLELAHLYFKEGRLEEAAAQAQKALRLAPPPTKTQICQTFRGTLTLHEACPKPETP